MPNLLNSQIAIVVLVGMLLLFFVAVFLLSLLNERTKKEQHKPSTKQPKQKQKERHEEIIDSLDWMLQHQIITTTEYNQLITKSLPFLG